MLPLLIIGGIVLLAAATAAGAIDVNADPEAIAVAGLGGIIIGLLLANGKRR